MQRIFVFLIFLLSMLGFFNPGVAFSAEKRVLLISSYHPGFPTFFQQIDGIKSAFSSAKVKLDVEFMDSKRFYDEQHLIAFHGLIKMKLSSVPPYDVIITSDDNALQFALQFRSELFPKTPVVFCGVNKQERANSLNSNSNFTGVIEAVSMRETLELAWKLFPELTKVFVIVDSTPSGQGDLKVFNQVKKNNPGIEFEELSLGEMDWVEFRGRLETLPDNSVIVLLSAFRDHNLIAKTFEKSLEFILSYSDVPVLHPYEHGLGKGILGGKVISHFEQGRIAGQLALDVMKGKSILEMPIIEGGCANKYVFDRKVLNRFNVDDSFLPAGSKIINEPSSLLKTYFSEIVCAFLFMLILTLFSVILLFYYMRLRKTEEKVRESEKRFALAMEANKDGVWDWNIETNDVYYSPGYKAMLGYKDDEIPFNVNTWLDLVHKNDRKHTFEANKDCIENRSSGFEVEFRMRAKNGEWRWILGRGNAVERDENGRALRMIGTHTDITERKRSEEEIRKLRNYLKSIIDSMPFILIGLDSDGIVTQWNAKAVEITGLSSFDAVGKPLEEVFPRLSPQMERVRESLLNQKIHIGSRMSRCDCGQQRYDDITIYPLFAEDEQGAVVLIDDVTERVRLEEMVVQSEKMLSVCGLAAGMAHEINNPLGAIIQGAQNIQRRAFGNLSANFKAAESRNISLADVQGYLADRDIPKILEGVNSAAVRAAEIVSNMLSFSRKDETNFMEHDISVLLDEVVELAATEYDLPTKYDFKKIEIEREYGKTMPVYCERNEIQQVFLNLFKNGVQSMYGKDYSSEGPKFNLKIYEQDDNVVVEIEDNGQGMDKDVSKRVFEPFYTTKQVGEGTGLGLAISYFIITDLHKGKMEVSSLPGYWTRFIITLPSGNVRK
ncbi:ABC transporter substrate binding protein [Maridesulfovibrio hydrothermalis]|uniref:histidine kinase n=1 Tax=Maridesulfovibrio hydrothermalis AM13 = DSM 14728 TaxID=1121451 RepID=L0RC64_9BACT|nr:ABC transporter substrate binding protein [Maridesulfovibrio hydrothermalis]CCO24368.1 Signal transduction histidine kinase, nitrogen specific, NtrB [Maridesulfovibrio hydrothermalis AM13 = DSM 14728]